jgi:hypothetical protein
MRHTSVLVCLLGALSLTFAPDGHAQTATNRLNAITATSAPVFVLPDNTRTPLRTLAPGTRLRVLRESGDWLRVEFQDPRWGSRVGYIERKHVDMAGPDIEAPAPDRKPPGRATPTPPGRTAPPKPVAPARAASPARVWIDASVGAAWAGEENYTSVATRQLNGQDATFQADYHLPIGVAFEIGGGVMATRQFGVGVTYGTTVQEDPADLSIEIPHPILPSPNATAAGVTDRALKRSESALHLHAAFASQADSRTGFRVFGGPTYFRIQQDAVRNILYDQQFLPFDPLNEVEITGTVIERIPYDEATGWGFHVGADVSWFYTPALGVGVVGRYSRGTVAARDPLSGLDTDLDVGGFQVGGGVRVRF